MSKLVSIILPFFNPPVPFFTEAIESVLAQSYPNWELILVNDGSNQAVTTIAKRFAEQHPDKIRCVAHPNDENRGTSAARNLGVQRSNGQLITYLDADDFWLPNKLAEQQDILSHHPQIGFVYGRELYWYSWSPAQTASEDDFYPTRFVSKDTVFAPKVLLPLWIRGQLSNPNPSSLMVRKSALDWQGGYEPAFRGLYDDQVFGAKLSLTHAAYVSTRCWNWYRQHPNSLCHQSPAASFKEARLTYLNWLEQYLRAQNVDDHAIWKALRQEQWLHQESNWLSTWSTGQKLNRLRKKWWLSLENNLLPSRIGRYRWHNQGNIQEE